MPTRRLAVVTGASSGLGAAIARLLLHEGYRVIAVARREEPLRQLEDLGTAEACVADLTTSQGRDAVCEAAHRAGGSLDLLVNNAGRGLVGSIAEADAGAVLETMRLNVEGTTLLTQKLLPAVAGSMERRILMVSSVAAVLPGPKMAVYYASKAFGLSLGLSLAEELRPRGITVTTVCPGPVATEFQRVAGFDEDRYHRTTKAADPEAVARWAYRAVRKRRRVAFYHWYIGSDLVARLLPRGIVARLMTRIQNKRAPH